MDRKIDCVALFVSVLFHSVLFVFPWQEKPRPLAESSAPVIPVSVIDVSQLPTPPVSEPQPTPAIPSSPPAPNIPSSPPVATIPSSLPVAIPVDPPADLIPEEPITETPEHPIDEPAPEAPLDADLIPEEPIAETPDHLTDEPAPEATPDSDIAAAATSSAVPSTPTSVTSTDEAKIAADWKNLVGHLQRQNEGFESFTLLDIFNVFGEPEQANQFFDENNQPRLQVSSFYLFPEQTPEQVLQTVVMPELTSNTGFDLQPQENFSAGLAYQLLQGEMLRYLIIVQLNERSGSVLILSDSLLGLES